MLCRAMARARLAMTTASETRSRRSTRMTTSAASDDALAPLAPMAMPTSAAASAGASLIPSPTISVGLRRCSVATASTLSEGTRSARTASRSRAAPIVSAASARSPVTITMRDTPALRSICTACGVSRLSSSPSSSAPVVRPSTDTNTLSAERQEARRSTRAAQSSGLRAMHQLVGSGADLAARDPPFQPGAHGLAMCSGSSSTRPLAQGSLHDCRRDHVVRGLLQ